MFSEKQIKEFIQNEPKDIATLIDDNGHERFIEGDIAPNESLPYTPIYFKWSLSGSHLMIVLFYSVANAATIPADTNLCEFELPSWVMDKIYPFTSNIVERKSVPYNNLTGGTQNSIFTLRKGTSTLFITQYASVTMSDDKFIRLSFDLIID